MQNNFTFQNCFQVGDDITSDVGGAQNCGIQVQQRFLHLYFFHLQVGNTLNHCRIRVR